VAATVWTLTALAAIGYLIVGVERRIADRSWENLSAPNWGLDFSLVVGSQTLRSLALTLAAVVSAVSLAGVWRITRALRLAGSTYPGEPA
jgi:hypothetical protein